MTRDESKASAMFGKDQKSSPAQSDHVVVDDQKIEQELGQME